MSPAPSCWHRLDGRHYGSRANPAGTRPVRIRRTGVRATKKCCTHLCPVRQLILYVQLEPAMAHRAPARRSSMNPMRSATGTVSLQRTSEVSPISSDSCVSYQLGPYDSDFRSLLQPSLAARPVSIPAPPAHRSLMAHQDPAVARPRIGTPRATNRPRGVPQYISLPPPKARRPALDLENTKTPILARRSALAIGNPSV